VRVVVTHNVRPVPEGDDPWSMSMADYYDDARCTVTDDGELVVLRDAPYTPHTDDPRTVAESVANYAPGCWGAVLVTPGPRIHNEPQARRLHVAP
jgi:hypothetical protein